MTSTLKLIWDAPTRAFHWLLVASVFAAIVTANIGGNLIVWHGRIGIGILGLLAFRLVWGVWGSTYARFAQFFPTPAKLAAYLRGQWQGDGHNPLGACSVLGLLALLLLQASSGLFSNDDIAFNGPLYGLVSHAVSNQLTELHGMAAIAIYAMIGLHIAAIGFYTLVKKDNLVKPMITGRKETKLATPPASGGGWKAFVAALLIALMVVYFASGSTLKTPAAPPQKLEAPSW